MMGVDMVIEYIYLKKGMDLDDGMVELIDHLNSLSLEDIKNFVLNASFDAFTHLPNNIDYDEVREIIKNEKDENKVNQELENVRSSIIALLEGITDSNREIAKIRVPGGLMIMSGGLSWGETPSEAMNLLYGFNCLIEEGIYPMKIIEKYGFTGWDEYESFIDTYEDKLTDNLKEDLHKWRVTQKI